MDGNISIDLDSDQDQASYSYKSHKKQNKHRVKNASVAHHLPVVTVCNMRSFFPKLESYKTDFFEHQVDASLLSEVWHKTEDKKHKFEIEKIMEMEY